MRGLPRKNSIHFCSFSCSLCDCVCVCVCFKFHKFPFTIIHNTLQNSYFTHTRAKMTCLFSCNYLSVQNKNQNRLASRRETIVRLHPDPDSRAPKRFVLPAHTSEKGRGQTALSKRESAVLEYCDARRRLLCLLWNRVNADFFFLFFLRLPRGLF